MWALVCSSQVYNSITEKLGLQYCYHNTVPAEDSRLPGVDYSIVGKYKYGSFDLYESTQCTVSIVDNAVYLTSDLIG